MKHKAQQQMEQKEKRQDVLLIVLWVFFSFSQLAPSPLSPCSLSQWEKWACYSDAAAPSKPDKHTEGNSFIISAQELYITSHILLQFLSGITQASAPTRFHKHARQYDPKIKLKLHLCVRHAWLGFYCFYINTRHRKQNCERKLLAFLRIYLTVFPIEDHSKWGLCLIHFTAVPKVRLSKPTYNHVL